ncbi:MAG: cobalamin-binding protein [Candidatus Aminicenantes bacterium]|nr:cobalamin-binding protein [Candidatus Aminicenantes bacterium]NIN17643.1 cobalamin-binding protein [Candidatus Aminicenantes bacterium]NIN41519.1 cobalamin-binding protein [Candidatus Aminicenantes bacterium]NIN84293.1 cobalamin-binding protein [Candidatus Aminicenantes bacterium]NIO80410.1 cobalamin-binding protein [Candidatus Aminicenantes bacterium]
MKESNMKEILAEIKKNIVEGRLDSEDEGFDGDMVGQPGVKELVKQALEENVSPHDIINESLNKGMEQVGHLYESNEYLLPDMMAAAECVSEAIKMLEPHLVKEDVQSMDRFVLATVEGDLHDIGKNIVATLLRGSGFQVNDLGTGIPADKIVAAVEETNAQYVGLSALLTTTMEHMPEVIEKLKEKGLRDKVKVFIGGAPLSAEFAEKIGADYYCEDAFEALEKLK